MKIGEHIYLVGSGADGMFLTDELDCNCYLLETDGELILFDSGVGIHPEKIVQEILKDGFQMEQLKYLCLTHCHADHAGGAYYFQEQYHVKVLAPEREADYLESVNEHFLGLDVAKKAGYYETDYMLNTCKADRKIAEYDYVTLGNLHVRTFPARGHSVGGVCYYGGIEGKRFLISGDLITAEGKISLQFIPGADVLDYAESVRCLDGFVIDYFLPGHGRFLVQQGERAVNKAIQSFTKLMVPV